MYSELATGVLFGAAAVTLSCAYPAAGAPQEPRKKMEITACPLKVDIQMTDALIMAIKALGDKEPKVAVRLTVDGVVPAENRTGVGGVRVFVNKDDATTESPISDPHFVSAFEFAPTGQRDPQGYNLALTRALKRLHGRGEVDPAKPLRITFVAVPAEGARALPEGFSVQVGKVAVEVVDLSK